MLTDKVHAMCERCSQSTPQNFLLKGSGRESGLLMLFAANSSKPKWINNLWWSTKWLSMSVCYHFGSESRMP